MVHLFRSLLLGLVLFFQQYAAAQSFQITFESAISVDDRDAREFIEEQGIADTIKNLINQEFKLQGDLGILFGGDRGPAFDELDGKVYVPYEFVYEVADRYQGFNPDSSDAELYDVTRDAVVHAVLHLVSHGLFEMYGFRTSTGKESAVDALATLLLIEYYEQGGEIVLNAASLFVSSDNETVPRQTGFWQDHRFNLQSFYQALCLVYGSNPELYTELERQSRFIQVRGRQCVEEYARQTSVWFNALAPHLKREPPE